MKYYKLLEEVNIKYASIESLTDFLESKFKEHGKNWAEDINYEKFDFSIIANQINNQIRTKFWYEPLTCNYLLLLLYSIFEVTLNNMCIEFKELTNSTISVDDFAGKGIRRSTRYLKKVAKLSNIDTHKEWVNLNSWALVRNAIAHSNSVISDSNKIKEVAKIISIKEEGGEIILNFKDINKFQIISKQYLGYVIDLLEQLNTSSF